MAETLVTFQSQLSGVMETVFKAAMYEITRLVEDSFLEEVTRCRDQVESLKRRLKWSESRRKEREGDKKGRCAECGRIGFSGEEDPNATGECVCCLSSLSLDLLIPLLILSFRCFIMTASLLSRDRMIWFFRTGSVYY